jgi:nucleotide-binding universal stress UspA family protein
MFDKILLPVDRSSLAECVLPHVIAIALAFESRVTLLHVMDVNNRASWRRAIDPLNWQIRKAEADTYMNDMTRRLQKAGLSSEVRILEGQAAERVVEFSRTNDIQLIILSSHGQSGLSGWNVSSVVQKIILRAHTSILIVRAYQPASTELTGLRYRRFLLPLDGSQRAECVLPAAAALARSNQAGILLAHVIQRPIMPRQTPPTREDTELADRVVARNRAEAVRYLEGLQSRLSGDIQTRLLVSDQPAATLHELADQEKIDLVLLSAHGLSALTRWPYGSVVCSFISYGTAPLLIVQDVPQSKIAATQAEISFRETPRR